MESVERVGDPDDDPLFRLETDELLRAHPVDVVEEEVTGTFQDEDDPDWLGGLGFADGTAREHRGGFPMYGSNYNNGLAADLGADINDDGTVAVDDHGRTSVDGLFAVGDLTPGHNQIPVAMGQGRRPESRSTRVSEPSPSLSANSARASARRTSPPSPPVLRGAARAHGDD